MSTLPGDFPEPPEAVNGSRTLLSRVNRLLVGGPKDPTDPAVFHRISLVAFLAWVGLGADGLSSSSYGPDEAFRTLVGHEYLALFVAALTTITIILLSYSYGFVVEHFPSGGGGTSSRASSSGRSRGSYRAPRWWWTTCSRSRSRSVRGSTRS